MSNAVVPNIALKLLLAFACLLCRFGQASAQPANERFVVYYGESAPIVTFLPYQPIVLDGDRHPPLGALKALGKRVFGYLSLGEVDPGRSYMGSASKAGVLLGSNPDWPGARYVDLRTGAWRQMVLEQLVPAILAQGFDGLFLDTLDDAATLEQADPKRNEGMVKAAISLIRALHERYPTVPLMLNRAYDVGVAVAPVLDAVLAESLASTYNFKSRKYHLQTAPDLAWGMARVSELRRANPALRIYTLDYWDPSDEHGVRRLYTQERQAGFVPYVATIDLQRVIHEPTKTGAQ
jgi:uncharacterized protein (TIGR01370 family)